MADIDINGLNIELTDYEVLTGEANMKKDAELLDEAVANGLKHPVMRLYGWAPACISLGRNQNPAFLDTDLLKSYNIDIVKRITGGRALFHDKELTYCFVTSADIIPNGENVTESYKFISGLWVSIFKRLGIELTIGGAERHISKNNYCMSISTGADLCYSGKKFIGSAQCRKNGYILQHGSILLDYDKQLLSDIFNEQTNFSEIVSLKEINPELTISDIIETVKSEFS